MTVEQWLKTACADADARAIPELKTLLETLARSTARLRLASEKMAPSHPGAETR